MELNSKYFSPSFRNLIWPCFEREFSGKRAHSLKNYKNTLVAFTNYVKKDFLQVSQEDVASYYGYLERKVEFDGMSRRTMLTYQKTLRAISCNVERYINENNFCIKYKNCFRNSIQGDVRKISEDIWLARDDEVSRILSQADTPKDMLLLLMIIKGGLTATQIGFLTWEGMTADEKSYVYDENGHSFETDELFLIAWHEYKDEIVSKGEQPGGLLFVNKSGNPVNTKGISTLIKRCREKAGVESEITARQLRDYGLTSRLFVMLADEESANDKAKYMDDSQITRMRELFMHFNIE